MSFISIVPGIPLLLYMLKCGLYQPEARRLVCVQLQAWLREAESTFLSLNYYGVPKMAHNKQTSSILIRTAGTCELKGNRYYIDYSQTSLTTMETSAIM